MSVKERAVSLHGAGFNCAQGVLCSCGAYTGLDEKTALAVVASAQFQQAKIGATEIVDGNTFTNFTGRYLVSPELKLVLLF